MRNRFPAEIISHRLWLYFRFPLSFSHTELTSERLLNENLRTTRSHHGGTCLPALAQPAPRKMSNGKGMAPEEI
jgi:transposase-like protein